MDVHIPKPVHGWRELAREIGIIVIGVLIALGAQQVVEWLHRRAEVAEARAALRSEIADNAIFARTTIELERCLSARWDGYAAWANGGPRPVVYNANNPAFLEPRKNIWEVVKTGAVAHMPLRERSAYARFYDAADTVKENLDLEVQVALRLTGDRAKAVLSASDAQNVLSDVGQMHLLGKVHSNNARILVESARALGVRPPMPADLRRAVVTLCQPVGITPSFD